MWVPTKRVGSSFFSLTAKEGGSNFSPSTGQGHAILCAADTYVGLHRSRATWEKRLTPIALVSSAAHEAIARVKLSGMASLEEATGGTGGQRKVRHVDGRRCCSTCKQALTMLNTY